jgi:hypothetical protein
MAERGGANELAQPKTALPRRPFFDHPCGFFGGSLCANSGHRSSINSRSRN